MSVVVRKSWKLECFQLDVLTCFSGNNVSFSGDNISLLNNMLLEIAEQVLDIKGSVIHHQMLL